MRTDSIDLLTLLSAASLVLISFDQPSHPPTPAGLAAIVLLILSTTIGLLSHRRLRRDAFQTVVSHYADRQLRNEAGSSFPTSEARSTAY